MADNGEGSSEAQPQELNFKVKSAGDKIHTVTMPESATVMELKTKLASEEFENVPAERQRLIYSGRVMKNDDKLETYKIKQGNTIHLVKSAASNPTPASTTTPAVPTNMAAGTNNDLLSGLTGARFAGMANLPSASIFGADGGMGAPPNPEEMAAMLEDPSMQQTMRAALDNPDFINMIVNSPMFRNVPGAREMLQSPAMRQMLFNPETLRASARMAAQMRGSNPAFPAPGATDSTPANAPASGATGAAAGSGDSATAGGAANPPANPFAAMPLFSPFGVPPAGAGGGANAQQNPFAALGGQNPSGSDPASPTQNPFLALFGNSPPDGNQQGPLRPPNFDSLRANIDALEQLLQGNPLPAMAQGAAAEAPVDNRPPEERWAEQLRQLNEMGFYDFDRNIAALRRSGGNVQGAIEHLLG